MKLPLCIRLLPAIIVTIVILLFQCLPAEAAREGEWYLGLKGGTYTPARELKDDGFNQGSALELSYGQFVMDNVVLEAGIGSFETSSTDIGYFADEKEELSIGTLTFTAKGVLSSPRFELAGGVGLGNYIVKGKYTATVSGNKDSDTASDVAPGFHLMAEATLKFTRNFFVVIEDRYIQTGSINLEYVVQGEHITHHTGLDGNLLMFSIGFRF